MRKKYTNIDVAEGKKKLTKAFKNMRKHGLIARMNFSCCQSCGGYDLATRLDESKNAEKLGYAFYHHQDNASICENGDLYIAYSAKDIKNKNAQEEANLKVALIVKTSLEEEGLDVEWNGSTDMRIKVMLIE